MANNGPNDNASQFFITLERADHLYRKNTIFGKVREKSEKEKEREGYGERERKREKEERRESFVSGYKNMYRQ